MTRRLPLFLFAAFVAASLLAAAPLAAQTPSPYDEPPAEAEPAAPPSDESEVGERVERAEQGTLQGSIVLLDADNLIIETAEGDRAFSIRDNSDLPSAMRDADDWATFRGVPVRITFAPGDEGELRVVRSVTLLEDGAPATTATTADTAGAQPFVATDESAAVEPGVTVERTETARTDEGAEVTTTTTTGRLIADTATDQADEERAAGTAAGFTDDDALPPGERMASLPATASGLPWLALLGTLALLAALGLGRIDSLRRRVAIDGRRR